MTHDDYTMADECVYARDIVRVATDVSGTGINRKHNDICDKYRHFMGIRPTNRINVFQQNIVKMVI